MALTIEDGSIVPGADSFALASELVTHAEKFGLVIPATEAAQESILRRAYLEMTAMDWKGVPVNEFQTGAFPRYNVMRFGWLVRADSIPAQIKAGQMALATEIHADDIDKPELRKGAVTKNRVEGAVEQQYAAAPASLAKPASTRQSYAQFAGFLESANQINLVRG
ncbi:MAG: DnaT-like ssDNA-binding protein [Gammaproteobacteria bacterium]